MRLSQEDRLAIFGSDLDQLKLSNELLKKALRESITIIEGLADQQAMQDDWYVDKLNSIKEICEKV